MRPSQTIQPYRRVPRQGWLGALRQEHYAEQDYHVEMYGTVLGRTIAELYREHFPWRVSALGV
jgi:hypothetical protein